MSLHSRKDNRPCGQWISNMASLLQWSSTCCPIGWSQGCQFLQVRMPVLYWTGSDECLGPGSSINPLELFWDYCAMGYFGWTEKVPACSCFLQYKGNIIKQTSHPSNKYKNFLEQSPGEVRTDQVKSPSSDLLIPIAQSCDQATCWEWQRRSQYLCNTEPFLKWLIMSKLEEDLEISRPYLSCVDEESET